MATVNWPGTFPQRFNEQGYRRRAIDPLIRTTVSSGPEKTRPRFTGQGGTISGIMPFSLIQYQALEAFIRDDLALGSVSFNFPDPDSLSTPPGMIPVKIRPIESTTEGMTRYVSITLQIQPSTPSTP